MEALKFKDKGPQDFVSDADLAVERHTRTLIAAGFPEDGIVCEEHDEKQSVSRFTRVVGPIEGTANCVAAFRP